MTIVGPGLIKMFRGGPTSDHLCNQRKRPLSINQIDIPYPHSPVTAVTRENRPILSTLIRSQLKKEKGNLRVMLFRRMDPIHFPTGRLHHYSLRVSFCAVPTSRVVDHFFQSPGVAVNQARHFWATSVSFYKLSTWYPLN